MSSGSKPLQGKTVIVAGASKKIGMGYAAALAMASQGANVVITGLPEKRADLSFEGLYDAGGSMSRFDDRVAELEALGVDAMAVGCDVTSKVDIEACVDKVVERFGSVDVLVNAFGTVAGAGTTLEDAPDEVWDLQYQVTFKGVVDFCKAVVPHMKDSGGSIVNIASIWVDKVPAHSAAYNSMKAATIGLTKTLAGAYGAQGIRVNAILPGTIRTDMNVAQTKMIMAQADCNEEEAIAFQSQNIAMKRLGEPSEIGSVVAFLAGDNASYITGAAIPVDGGVMEGL